MATNITSAELYSVCPECKQNNVVSMGRDVKRNQKCIYTKTICRRCGLKYTGILYVNLVKERDLVKS